MFWVSGLPTRRSLRATILKRGLGNGHFFLIIGVKGNGGLGHVDRWYITHRGDYYLARLLVTTQFTSARVVVVRAQRVVVGGTMYVRVFRNTNGLGDRVSIYATYFYGFGTRCKTGPLSAIWGTMFRDLGGLVLPISTFKGRVGGAPFGCYGVVFGGVVRFRFDRSGRSLSDIMAFYFTFLDLSLRGTTDFIPSSGDFALSSDKISLFSDTTAVSSDLLATLS